MKVTLQLSDGREMTFSVVESITIDEEKKISETTNKKQTAEVSKTKQDTKTYEIADTPTEGKCFEVNLETFNQKLFSRKRKDARQEKTRQLILEAFAELKNNPEKYGKNFKTMMPRKIWSSKTVAQLKEMACKLGDHNADWVEQALEWARRIANGESWETICNDADTANWYRLVVWKNGYTRLVGGSRKNLDISPTSGVVNGEYCGGSNYNNAVPLVVLYE